MELTNIESIITSKWKATMTYLLAVFSTHAAFGQTSNRPNIVVIMADDMGYSDIGCYGSEIKTPNIDQLAANGIRFRTFYNNAKSCPTRASLMTGLYNHEAGMGNMVIPIDREIEQGPYQGFLNENSVTIPEVLRKAGYSTYMSGKWHLGERKEHWPLQRGFDKYFGLISGASSYFEIVTEPRKRMIAYNNESWTPPAEGFYMTSAISDSAASFIQTHADSGKQNPFFLYLAYTSPHWPLHALEDDIKKYEGVYEAGWDQIRQERYKRMKQMGIITPDYHLSPRSPEVESWDGCSDKALWIRRMQVYAAMIDRMDQGVGKIMAKLKELNKLENTMIIFLADNGACNEDISARKLAKEGVPVGRKGSYDSYLSPWANASNTPFRMYKNWLYEGGTRTPFIVQWPGHIHEKGSITTQVGHITDIMATCIDATKANYPEQYHQQPIKPLRGQTLLNAFNGKTNDRKEPVFWEYVGHKAIIDGKWKLVRTKETPWELYNLENDPTELNDLSSKETRIMKQMENRYSKWAKQVGVRNQ